jgi:MFS family permease
MSSSHPPTAILTAAAPWYRTITAAQWKVLAAAKLGWMLDAMDFVLYAMAIGQLRAYFAIDDAAADLLGTVTLVMSAFGGVVFGYVADRVARARALILTILIFSLASLASLGASTSRTIVQLMMWRALLGVGMGGEWASGAVLVSESWPPRIATRPSASCSRAGRRLRAGRGDDGAVPRYIQSGPRRVAVTVRVGVVPALFTLWVRRSVPEPVSWIERGAAAGERRNPFGVIFGPAYRTRTLPMIALNSAVQFGYWGVFFWLPGFLAKPVAQGGAGMTVVGSIPWILSIQIGAYCGYLSFGFIADRLGRRVTFILFMLTAAIVVPVYGQMARSPMTQMLLGPVFGYAAHGYFSLFGTFIAEIFPTAVRATRQGICYNLGRLAGAIAPYTIGALATVPTIGIVFALATTSVFFLATALLILTLPDRSGRPLDA